MCAQNLWGNLEDIGRINTPLAVLREQAQLLTGATKGVLSGSVLVSTSYSEDIVIELTIVVPTLNNYKYRVLRVQHHPINIYPLDLACDPKGIEVKCNNEEDFIGQVESVLSSTEVRNVIKRLISQVEEE